MPGSLTIFVQLKNNPNPVVRASAVEALSYIQNPAYKNDLNTIFTIAQNNVDPAVQDAAKEALKKLNELDQPAQNAPQAATVEMKPAAEAPAQAA